MWGKELKKEGGKKEAGLEWNLFQSSSEIKTVTLPLHWIILKMDIISNFFWGGDLKTLTSRKCPTDSQAELQYSVPYGTEKVSWWTYNDRFSYSFTQKWKVRAFNFARCKVSETHTYSFSTNICTTVEYKQILLAISVNVVLMLDDGPQDWNMWYLMMKLITFVAVDINRYVALNILYHNGMN